MSSQNFCVLTNLNVNCYMYMAKGAVANDLILYCGQ